MMNGVIYKLTAPDGKGYIGKSTRFAMRMRDYETGMVGKWKARGRIVDAIAKYGWENFEVTVLASGIKTPAELNAAEVAAIAEHNTMWPAGYNRHAGGAIIRRGFMGPPRPRRHKSKPMSDAARLKWKRKLSARAQARNACPEYRAWHWNQTHGDKTMPRPPRAAWAHDGGSG